MHHDLLEEDLITGEFPEVEDALTAARCFLQSDAPGVENAKHRIWLNQLEEEFEIAPKREETAEVDDYLDDLADVELDDLYDY